LIETFLMWFPQYRELRKRVARAERRYRNAELRAEQAQQRYDEMAARFDRECAEHKADLKSSADTLAKPLTGRYMYARQSDGDMQIVAEQQPVPSRPLAHDVKAQRTKKFYEQLKREMNGTAGDNGTANAA